MKQEVQDIVRAGYEAWLRDQAPENRNGEVVVAVETPPGNVPGDLACSLPMVVAKKLKRAPRDVAQGILAKLPQGLVERAEIAGPGFLNLYLSGPWLTGELSSILNRRDRYAERASARAERVLIEFVSANPNGPLHVGHGRGAALGDSLARIFRLLGYRVETEYYINNMGNQMENLGASVMSRCVESDPSYLSAGEKAALAGKAPEDLYKGDYIKDVALAVMKEFPDPAARPQGLAFFREQGIRRILEMIRSDLERFDVKHDNWFPESELHDQGAVDQTLAKLRRNGYLRDEDGALWFASTQFGDDKDRVIKRKDERPTYFASDIAYHDRKFERGYDRLVDIWGTDHHGYVARVKAAMQALGRDPGALTILLYQLVSLVRAGKPVAMSTRSGEFITLTEVIDEVGKDGCRFWFAMRSPNSHLEFDLDLAKKQAPENPVFYVQYCFARCCSLFREAAKRGLPADEAALKGFKAPAALDPHERSLLFKLASFPDVVEQCKNDLSPHHLTAFLQSLAAEYHRFYENCRVLGDPGDVTTFRLALVDGVRTVIRSGLSLLGVSAPEVM